MYQLDQHDVSIKSTRYITKIATIHHLVSRMARYIIQIEDTHHSISRMTRNIHQIDKTYRSKQQDISIKSTRYIIKIGRIYRQDCKSYQNDWRICTNNWYILAKVDLFVKATTRRIVSSRFETLP